MLTTDDADFIVSYIQALEERANHQQVMNDLERDGYTHKEIDGALKALGKIAGRDCGIL